MKTDIRSLTYDALSEAVLAAGGQKFRIGQVYGWLHDKGVMSFDEMKNVPQALKDKLAENYYISTVAPVRKLVSQIDGTTKYLFELSDGETVETVVMRYKHGLSVCISTQVGCKMGCSFCASTIAGFVRHLTAGEMEAQILAASNDLGERIGNVVMMGIGEPLDNYDNTVSFLRNITDERGQNLSARHISLSTCGLPHKIRQLAQEDLPITLCLSLHAPFDEMRDRLMPINKAYKLDEVLDACAYYQKTSGRRITFEYTLIKGVNDTDECADKLISICKKMMCHVNLIPVNHVEETGYTHANNDHMERFKNRLTAKNVNATLRRTLGEDISAACGQLRRKEMNK